MNIEKYTDRARGFVQSAQSLALREGHQQFTPEHILKVLLDDPEGLASGLIDRSGGNARQALAATEEALNKMPKVSGGGAGQVYLAAATARLFDNAEKIAEKAGDSYVTVERLLLAIALEKDVKKWNDPKGSFRAYQTQADVFLALAQGQIEATVVTSTVAAATVKAGKYKDLMVGGDAPYDIDYVSLEALADATGGKTKAIPNFMSLQGALHGTAAQLEHHTPFCFVPASCSHTEAHVVVKREIRRNHWETREFDMPIRSNCPL